MNDDVYVKLAKVLDTHPSGFPSTEDGLEIKVLKEIFTHEQADLFCDLKIRFETAEEIAERTGRPLKGLEELLLSMLERGQIGFEQRENSMAYKMVPFAVGIFEYQLPRLYPKLAELLNEYNTVFTPQFIQRKPHFLQVVPIEEEILTKQEALPYERISAIVEKGQSFAVMECVCKKTMRVIGKGCNHQLEVCLIISQQPRAFENFPIGRSITKEAACEVLKNAEEDALVHMIDNIANDHTFICNCCGCCCGVLKNINKFGILDAINTHYYAEIDAEKCETCGTCADERCQVNAIEEGEDSYRVIREKCIGCGLCAQTCPAEAIRLVRKLSGEQVIPPKNEADWFEERGRTRGVNFSMLR